MIKEVTVHRKFDGGMKRARCPYPMKLSLINTGESKLGEAETRRRIELEEVQIFKWIHRQGECLTAPITANCDLSWSMEDPPAVTMEHIKSTKVKSLDKK